MANQASRRGRPPKKTGTAKKPPAGRAKKEEPAMSPQKKQGIAVILFAVSIFILFVVLIPGQNVWNAMHGFIFGLFGVCAYVLPIVLCYVSVMLALNKMFDKIRNKVIESLLLIILIGLSVEVFVHPVTEAGFLDYITTAYTNGALVSGGGFLSSLLAYPLLSMFGEIGARITAILLVFVLLMLITGTTLLSLFKTASKPIKKIRERVPAAPWDGDPRFDVDVSLGNMPDHPVQSDFPFNDELDNLAFKEKKLVETYADVANDEPKPKKKPNPEKELESIVKRESKKLADSKEPAKSSKSAEFGFSPASISMGPSGETYRFPPTSILSRPSGVSDSAVGDEMKANAERLVNTLKSFGVETRIINISRGPSVTRYELQPSAGVKISKITNLSDDIALNLAASAVRIEAPIPNKSAVGIEIPNKTTSLVSMNEMVESPVFLKSKSRLTAALGKDIAGNIATADLAKMPHLLIAGSTGSGKSVCINSLIISMLYKAGPEEVKFLMIDPKVVELGIYNGIPHLLVPVVTDPRKAAGALGWAVTEMLKRYKIFADNNVRDLNSYNEMTRHSDTLKPMPQIVIIIDELADLMMAAPNEVEDSICRLAQMARAAGMHLVIATQRPSVDVITGIIKANIPSRIAFAVSSQVDSRTILDMGGAEKLMGRGDMLYFPVGMSKPLRVQGCFVSDHEIKSVVDFIKNSGTADYDEEVITEIEKQAVPEKGSKAPKDDGGSDEDERMSEAIEVAVEAGQISTSLLQRRLKLGYARAARIIDEMEERGLVGPFEGSKPRKVLISKQQWLEMQAQGE